MNKLLFWLRGHERCRRILIVLCVPVYFIGIYLIEVLKSLFLDLLAAFDAVDFDLIRPHW